MLDEEVDELTKALPVVRKYLSSEHIAAIERSGVVEGEPGEFVTACVEQRACVFVTYDDGIAKCSIERAYFNGELSWRKPLSCHLFPLRIDRGLRNQVRFEYFSECQPALEHGQETNTPLSLFVKDALIRAYGAAWYQKLLNLFRSTQSAKSMAAVESGRGNP